MKLTHEDVQEILRLLDAGKYDDLHVETEQFKLTLRRHRESADWQQEEQVLSAPNIGTAPSARDSIADDTLRAAAAKSQDALEAARPQGARDAAWVDVRAHLPGTFYRAPNPGAPPFVETGSAVKENTVVGIIETMKLMNAVHAEARGEVAEICRNNAQFVEKDAVLMRIKPGDA